MRVIPAIDLLDGRAVRLREGKKDEVTVYREHPEELVAELAAGGAERIHVVDLDGAFAGESRNAAAVEAILKATKNPVQLGGGIRTLAQIEAWLARSTASAEGPVSAKGAGR